MKSKHVELTVGNYLELDHDKPKKISLPEQSPELLSNHHCPQTLTTLQARLLEPQFPLTTLLQIT
ncbi:hypothetical protein HanRHA438_Chr14g0673671 [Helianthus annuus]|nr:hypothetical protein HanRHA438_Chr14g0673671 [Helianthus annuus]